MIATPNADALRHRKLPVDHAILWGPASAGTPRPLQQPYPLFVHQTSLQHLVAHVRSDPAKELLGFFLGDLYECPETAIKYVVIQQILRIGADASQGQTAALMARLWPMVQEKVGEGRAKLVGWYHSHSKGSVFPHADDVEAFATHFTEPWQAGLILGVEDGKPGATWFRLSDDRESLTTGLSFFELLAPESIDPNGKKRTFVSWANFKSYKAGAPTARAAGARPSASVAAQRPSAAAPAPPRQAAPRQSVPAAAPPPEAPPRPSVPAAAPPPQASPPAAPAAPSVPAATPPPQRPSVPAAAPPPAAPVRRSIPTPVAPEPAEPEPPPRRPPSAVPSIIDERPRPTVPRFSMAPVVSGPVVQETSGGRGRLWLGGAIGAAVVALAIVGAWVAGVVQFGGGSASPSGTDVAASDTQPAVENTTPPPAPVDPALVALDLISDTVETTVGAYHQSRTSFDNNQADCTSLADALVAVEEIWIAYNVRGKPRDVVLDPNRAARDRSLYARVDSVETDFDGTSCPRP